MGVIHHVIAFGRDWMFFRKMLLMIKNVFGKTIFSSEICFGKMFLLILCHNQNMEAYDRTRSHSSEIGIVREAFFACMLNEVGQVTAPLQGDYVVNSKILFEVGGRRKSFKQIKDIPDSYLAVDDTLVGRGNKIPLWLFGFLK